MLLFLGIVAVLAVLSKIPVGEPYIEVVDYDPYDNGTKEKFILDNAWEFKSLDDCMEFRELRQTGWKGNALDFYRLKEEE